jgi:hypothetical protein
MMAERLFHKGDTDAVGINRGEFLGTPWFGLQRSIGMYLSATLLELRIKGFNTCDREPDHRLITHRSCQLVVVHPGYMDVGSATLNSRVVRWSGIAKRFGKAAHFRPPSQRFRGVGGGKNWNCVFDEGFHSRSILEAEFRE